MLEITQENIQKEVLESNQPVIVDLWAPWCGPCRQFTPVMESLSEKYKEIVKIVKCNVDEHSEIAEQYQVRGIPTLLAFKEGKLVDTRVGTSQLGLEEWIESLCK